jgi:polar amino acid transport system substrate-binding protein
MQFRRSIITVILVVSAALCFGAIASAGELQRKLSRESTIEAIMKRGSIRVGFDVFVPWAMKDKKGKFIGFEIDCARKLADDMGVKLELIPTKWSGIIPALISSKFDVLIGGMTITTKRNLKINFTNPYYFTEQALMAHKVKAAGMTIDDFNSPKVMIAARLGSTASVAAKHRFPKAKLRLFDDEPSAVQELRNGNVHGMVGGQPQPTLTAQKYPETIKMYPDALLLEANGIGLRKGDHDTMVFLNSWIEINKNNGWLQGKYEYWFKSRDWAGMIE